MWLSFTTVHHIMQGSGSETANQYFRALVKYLYERYGRRRLTWINLKNALFDKQRMNTKEALANKKGSIRVFKHKLNSSTFILPPQNILLQLGFWWKQAANS